MSDISDDVFQSVSRDVIGYCTSDDAKQWRTASGTNKKVLNEVKSYFSYLLKDTGFSPDNYDDGIYDITVDDYWSYYKKISDNPRPKFTRTHSIKFIKNSGYFMFVSVAEKGTTCLLQGGSLRSLKKPLQYYYNRLPEYATIILQKFSKYWDALYSISKQIQTVAFDEEEMKKEYEKYIGECKELHVESLDFDFWSRYKGNAYKFSGKVHGCIVDIDFFNHIYLNPFDGTITPYSALSMDMKYAYKICEYPSDDPFNK